MSEQSPNAEPTIVPGRYRHFKGNVYQVLGTFQHTEEPYDLVAYVDETDPTKRWVRPLNYGPCAFDDKTIKPGSNPPEWIPRFTYIGPISPAFDGTGNGDPAPGCGCGADCNRSPGDPCPLTELQAIVSRANLTVADIVRHTGWPAATGNTTDDVLEVLERAWRHHGFVNVWHILTEIAQTKNQI